MTEKLGYYTLDDIADPTVLFLADARYKICIPDLLESANLTVEDLKRLAWKADVYAIVEDYGAVYTQALATTNKTDQKGVFENALPTVLVRALFPYNPCVCFNQVTREIAPGITTEWLKGSLHEHSSFGAFDVVEVGRIYDPRNLWQPGPKI